MVGWVAAIHLALVDLDLQSPRTTAYRYMIDLRA